MAGVPFTAKKGEVCKVLTPTRALRAQAREYERQIVCEQRAALKAADNAKKPKRLDSKENEEEQEE